MDGWIVYENEKFMVLLDIFPKNKGHLLVIPIDEYENMFEMPEDLLKEMILLTKKVANVLKDTFEADGIKLMQNNGKAAGQEVFHYHMHIMPFYEDSTKNEGKSNFKEIQTILKNAIDKAL